MKLKRRDKSHAAVEASSLSDILFFLMLFFLMISTMASPSAIKLLLPKSSSQPTKVQENRVNLSIDANIKYAIDSESLVYDQLKPKLEEIKKSKPDPTIVIHADKTITIEELIKIVDIVNELELKSVIATEKKK